jgi:neurotransmitter:Na+ symporter, NSS family
MTINAGVSQGVTSGKTQWSSQLGFILAAAGSAVGLGNIWKFPYMTGENGGGAFVLVYLGCIALVGVPALMTEMLVGRRGGQSPVQSVRDVVTERGRSGHGAGSASCPR